MPANVYLSEASGTGRTLTVNGTGNATITGVIANYNGGAGSGGGLTYAPASSSQVLTLTASNTYSGATQRSTTASWRPRWPPNGTPFGTGTMVLANGTLSLQPSGIGCNGSLHYEWRSLHLWRGHDRT